MHKKSHAKNVSPPFQVDIYSLSRTWGELVQKARSKSLSPAEYNSGERKI